MSTNERLFEGKIEPRSITDEIQQSYLDYAMSVIVSRALPDVRDGLKPVHRRILYSMWTTGLKSGAKFRKSATVVGDVLGKYHPHGDMAVYDSMVRMAQDFSLRYPLVWGQGNFGSMDGDSPAAYRYTEAKLQKIAEEMLLDIEKKTVNFVENFDGVHREPTVLPAKLPQLLLNGTVGIAVGMATNIPPHNLGELVDGTIHLIDNPQAGVDDLMQFIKGPDFPTGGIIFSKQDIRQAYGSGRGKIVTRAKTDIEEYKNGYFCIVVSEMTYQTNKADLIERMATLVNDGKIQGIKDIRDESDKDGVRVVIELKKDAYPQKVLNKIFATTDLQKNFSVNMLALVDGIEPQILNLKSILSYFIAHREEVVERRTKYDLERARERAHILEGLKRALDHINEVIEIIKKSRTKETAHANLRSNFKLSDKQATAILEMRLQTLAGLERKKIEDELKEKRALIKKLEGILADRGKRLDIIKEELTEIKKLYNNHRQTKVVATAIGEISDTDTIPNDEAIITLSRDGYIKRMNPTVYRVQKRGGKGVIGAITKENDIIDQVLAVMAHDDVFFFTNFGKVYQIKAYEIPESSRTSKGNAVINFLQMSGDERVTEVVVFGKDDKYKYLFMTTKKGVVKKCHIEEFSKVRRNGLLAIRLDSDDELGWVRPTFGSDEVVIITSHGQAIRFKEKNVRAMGRTAAGVRGIKLKTSDRVVGMALHTEGGRGNEVFILTENGYGKRSSESLYKQQNRGGSGIKTAKITDKTGNIVWGDVISKDDLEYDVIVTSTKGQIIRTPLKNISKLGRSTQGVKVMRTKKDDKIATATIL